MGLWSDRIRVLIQKNTREYFLTHTLMTGPVSKREKAVCKSERLSWPEAELTGTSSLDLQFSEL